MLSISNLSKSYGDRLLFERLNLTITTGQRIALIGANGSGKSNITDAILFILGSRSTKLLRARKLKQLILNLPL